MDGTKLHASLLGRACEHLLGRQPVTGSMAFVRCLRPDVVYTLAADPSFASRGWQVWRVADGDDPSARTITADRAVEIRETKEAATLLLVDTALAGAGMDGIYSAAREMDEQGLFTAALRLAKREVTEQLSGEARHYAERAITKARDRGHYSIPPWTEFDFLCRIAAARHHPGAYLHLLGLWPVQESEDGTAMADDELDVSRRFVERLLRETSLLPAKRIETLRLQPSSPEQRSALMRFLHAAAAKPSLLSALAELSAKENLWVNALPIEQATCIQRIELMPWRIRAGKIAKWSGLTDRDANPPELILKPDVKRAADYSKLEVRWKAQPANLEKDAATYRVVITTDMDEELATQEVVHSGRREEKCRFNNDDFSDLSEDARIPATVMVSVLGNDRVEAEKSKEFIIRFGEPPEDEKEQGGVGRAVRAFSEGLIELESREAVSEIASATSPQLTDDAKGFVLLRTTQHGKSFRVFRPSLIAEVEEQWQRSGEIGRWRVRVRAAGTRAGKAEFMPFASPEPASKSWERVTDANRKMADRFLARGGGVGQIYDERSKMFDPVVKEYLLAWAALLEEGDPCLALANTVEVQSLSGQTIGLIVLPGHPLRVAWQVAYDNLVLHAKFDQERSPKEIREELSSLDGAMFPALLPGLQPGRSFVFADTLGFHAVGMVRDDDKEPKAALAILSRAMGESEVADAAPTVGKQSATALGNEIVKYLECHSASRLLRIHSLRAGDGLTMARSLGHVHQHYHNDADEDAAALEDTDSEDAAPAFVLEFYPSPEQRKRGIAGRFIAEARQKRRRRAGGDISPEDAWMLESLRLPGGVSRPRLSWARKDAEEPDAAAHLAVAFDTFTSHITPEDSLHAPTSCPFHAFGLLSFFQRTYTNSPSPLWHSSIPPAKEGEKHPSDRAHTDRLTRLQDTIQRSVARHIGAEGKLPTLRTEISADKAQTLKTLHRLCDWVITLDRNAGIEYFDSPRENEEIYNAYVIDCVPEREDLGGLQLITSTSHREDVYDLLNRALDPMGLSHSHWNAERLLDYLKALSGRFAIRLTGQKAVTADLVALAASYGNCLQAPVSHVCWASLDQGFIIPVDDVADLLPPLRSDNKEERPDLIYVSTEPRKGLSFRFIKVTYRRHLRAARAPEILQNIDSQLKSLRKRWDDWYGHESVCSSFRAIRRAKLARVLRFYADKAQRHYLPEEQHEAIIAEIDRMISRGGNCSFAEMPEGDRGWVLCPEFAGTHPLEISPVGWNTRIFLFGPNLLSDSIARLPDQKEQKTVAPPARGKTEKRELDDRLDDDKLELGEGRETDQDGTSTEHQKKDGEDVPSICFGNEIFGGSEVHWPLTTKGNPHLMLAGLPGMGKTTCLLNLCRQMVTAGVRPIIFSYHQDIDERLEKIVDSVRYIDCYGLGFNPLQVMDRSSRLAYLDVASAVRDIFTSIFPELGDIQGGRIRRAIKDSFIETGWDNPNADLVNLPEPEFKRFLEILKADPKPDRGLRTLLARLEELEDYGFFELTETRESLWESDQPIVIRIHTTQNDNLQKAFASLIFYGLYKDMFRRGVQDHITHAVIFDEAHRAAGLKLIPKMAKECRKFGISLVLASQEAKDFDSSLFSAIANYLVLRLTEADAKSLVRMVGSSQQERDLIDKIKQMDRFKAIYFSEGKKRPSSVGLLQVED